MSDDQFEVTPGDTGRRALWAPRRSAAIGRIGLLLSLLPWCSLGLLQLIQPG